MNTIRIVRAICPETGSLIYAAEGQGGRTEWQTIDRFETFLRGAFLRLNISAVLTKTMSFGRNTLAGGGGGYIGVGTGSDRTFPTLFECVDWYWQHWWDDAYDVDLAELVNRCNA